MVRLTRQYKFAASHRLHSDSLDEETNQRIYGKCNNPYGHGHDYVLQVRAAGAVDEETGLLLNLERLDGLVKDNVLSKVRDRNLNDLAMFERLVPTTENLASEIERRLREAWPADWPALEGVRIQETRRNIFETKGMRR